MKQKMRCPWPSDDLLMIKYHEKEWGVPLHNDRKLFEFLILEGFQAGLSWRTILHKRENFREAFDNFDYNKVAKYDKRKVNSLLKDAGIIRNKLKIESAIANAKAFLLVRKEFGTFDKYIWSLVNGKPIQNKFKSLKEFPAKTELSDKISNELRKRGFKFVGSTIVYAHMQATGMVNDHVVSCYRHGELVKQK
jgi:DNA-3-methyladenine glycosylase I